MDAPSGSMPGSSGDGAPRPPRVKTELDREADRVEDLMDEVHRIKDECVMGAFETEEPVLDHQAYNFKASRR